MNKKAYDNILQHIGYSLCPYAIGFSGRFLVPKRCVKGDIHILQQDPFACPILYPLNPQLFFNVTKIEEQESDWVIHYENECGAFQFAIFAHNILGALHYPTITSHPCYGHWALAQLGVFARVKHLFQDVPVLDIYYRDPLRYFTCFSPVSFTAFKIWAFCRDGQDGGEIGMCTSQEVAIAQPIKADVFYETCWMLKTEKEAYKQLLRMLAIELSYLIKS